jgi:primosomal protein N' (replication factor Y) (superfamily II helicase)
MLIILLFKKMDKKESIKKYYYDVIPSYNIKGTLLYTSDIKYEIGSIIRISLRKKEVLGCVLDILKKKPHINFKVKDILENKYKYKFNKNIIDFLFWVSKYNVCNLGLVLKLIIPNDKFIKTNTKTFFKENESYSFQLKEKQKEFLSYISKNYISDKEILDQGFYKKSFIDSLVKKKIVYKNYQVDKEYLNLDLKKIKLNKLSYSQDKVYYKILNLFKIKQPKPIYFDGVTGSGKTEVYFKLIKNFLKEEKQVLVLIPEIALSKQWINRFYKVFQFEPFIWNSSIKISEKKKIWQAAINGDSLIVVGTRSSIFLPFSNLGVTIIDEENDVSYKQEEQAIYHARDMAIVKSKINKSNIILVSATPSIETYYNYNQKKYHLVSLEKRFGKAKNPKINLIDMKYHNGKLFSSNALKIIKKKLREKKQVLILINRRGYAPITLCSKCGAKDSCKYCDINLVHHKSTNMMVCHHCGYTKVLNSDCNSCKRKNSIISLGYGIEKVVEEINHFFKNCNLVSLSSDTIRQNDFLKTLKEIEDGKIEIIIGTQIISKGFNFLKLDSVFILDFDMWFYNADIRTNEKIFQLTQQVSGRTSRADDTGEVYIQTYDTDSYLLKILKSNNKEDFYKKELALREQGKLPPYKKLVAIILLSKELEFLKKVAIKIKSYFEGFNHLEVLGPIPAPIEYIRSEYRYRILIKTNQSFLVQNILKGYDFKKILRNKVKVKIDIDPLSFF